MVWQRVHSGTWLSRITWRTVGSDRLRSTRKTRREDYRATVPARLLQAPRIVSINNTARKCLAPFDGNMYSKGKSLRSYELFKQASQYGARVHQFLFTLCVFILYPNTLQQIGVYSCRGTDFFLRHFKKPTVCPKWYYVPKTCGSIHCSPCMIYDRHCSTRTSFVPNVSVFPTKLHTALPNGVVQAFWHSLPS
jgi:hypothetical protein